MLFVCSLRPQSPTDTSPHSQENHELEISKGYKKLSLTSIYTLVFKFKTIAKLVSKNG